MSTDAFSVDRAGRWAPCPVHWADIDENRCIWDRCLRGMRWWLQFPQLPQDLLSFLELSRAWAKIIESCWNFLLDALLLKAKLCQTLCCIQPGSSFRGRRRAHRAHGCREVCRERASLAACSQAARRARLAASRTHSAMAIGCLPRRPIRTLRRRFRLPCQTGLPARSSLLPKFFAFGLFLFYCFQKNW